MYTEICKKNILFIKDRTELKTKVVSDLTMKFFLFLCL
jgi:hypothetical protein